MKTLSAIIVITFFSAIVFAQAGELDSTFGGDGKVMNYVESFGVDDVRSLAIQTNGKIIVGGTAKSGVFHWDGFLVRYNVNGTVDSSFAYDGILLNQGLPYKDVASVAIQNDGKIVFVGTDFDIAYLSRLNSDGSYDASFGTGGSFEDPDFYFASDLAIQTDGKIIATGGSVFNIFSFNTNGNRDSTFGFEGMVLDTVLGGVHSLAIQSDGKILAATSVNLIRLNGDGSFDSSFNANGIAPLTLDIAYSSSAIAVQDDGQIIIGGMDNSNYPNFVFALARYNSDGTSDNAFGSFGLASVAIGTSAMSSSVAIQSDGKIVVAGSSGSDFAVARFNVDGTIDGSFGTNGTLTTDFNNNEDAASSVAMEPNGKIVAAGSSNIDLAVACYLSGLNVGILNLSSPQSFPLIYPNPIHQTETLEYTLTKNELLTIALFDVNGMLIRNFISNEQRAAGEHKETLNIGELTSGNYFLTVSNGSQKMTVKMVKQ